jgi:hypothetical protein
MGERTTVSGHIQEPWHSGVDSERLRILWANNWRVIRALPDKDDWPFLSCGMFAHSPNAQSDIGHPTSTNRGRVIYFGGSFSSLYLDWKDWRAKFETLLRKMYWDHAAVLVVTEWVGTHHYTWRPTQEAANSMIAEPPLPVSEWTCDTSANPL